MAGEESAECELNWLQCAAIEGSADVIGGASEAADSAVSSVANSALESFVNAMYEFSLWILEIISTWWMNTPVADVEGGAVLQIQQDIQWYVMGFVIIGFLIGLIRMVGSQDIRQGLQTSFKPIVNLILVTGVYATGVTMLLQAGDEGSEWLLARATEGEADLTEMFMPAAAGGGAAALLPMLLVYVLAGLGGIVNFVFMIFRNLLLVVLMAFLPALAAATGTQRGDQAFGKANGWLIALLLFKPVAAGIYALGFRFMRNETDMEGFAGETQLAVDQLTGAGIILLAALALPALIKFLVPAAATGAAAFSGGAAVGAGVGVAAGAAVLAGTGGAAAAGGAGSGSGGSGGGVSSGAGGGTGSASTGGALTSGSESTGTLGAGPSGGDSSGAGSAGGGSAGGAGLPAGSSGGDSPSGGGAATGETGSGGSPPSSSGGPNTGGSPASDQGSVAPGGSSGSGSSGGGSSGGSSSGGASVGGGSDSAGSSTFGGSSAAGAGSSSGAPGGSSDQLGAGQAEAGTVASTAEGGGDAASGAGSTEGAAAASGGSAHGSSPAAEGSNSGPVNRGAAADQARGMTAGGAPVAGHWMGRSTTTKRMGPHERGCRGDQGHVRQPDDAQAVRGDGPVDGRVVADGAVLSARHRAVGDPAAGSGDAGGGAAVGAADRGAFQPACGSFWPLDL